MFSSMTDATQSSSSTAGMVIVYESGPCTSSHSLEQECDLPEETQPLVRQLTLTFPMVPYRLYGATVRRPPKRWLWRGRCNER